MDAYPPLILRLSSRCRGTDRDHDEAGGVLYQLRHVGALLGIAAALVLGLVLHDGAQTLAARALGDDTPVRAKRLTAGLGPRTDPYGAVAAVVVGWGWGTPVPMEQRWRARRGRLAITLMAGPLTYLGLTLLAVLALRYVVDPVRLLEEFPGRACAALAYTWGALVIVSLLPLPPLDGGRTLFALAPQSLGWQKARDQLEGRNLGLVLALVVVLVPRLFPGFPDVVGQLMPPLLDALGSLVGAADLGAAANFARAT